MGHLSLELGKRSHFAIAFFSNKWKHDVTAPFVTSISSEVIGQTSSSMAASRSRARTVC